MSYTSQYPPAQNDTYVKATTKYDTTFWPYFATDPTKLLTGGWGNSAWVSVASTNTNQRFHIDLGSAKVVKRIYYENAHSSGTATTAGVYNYTFWGSNNAAAFAELTYGTDTNWTQIGGALQFAAHTASDVADPKYQVVPNQTAYRYYAFKISNNYGLADYMAVRRIELQTSDENPGAFLNLLTGWKNN